MISNQYMPVRLSHLLRHSAVGAIVRNPRSKHLMTVKDIRFWRQPGGGDSGRVIPYVEQVKSALNITQDLREPSVARELANGRIDGAWIPAMGFPAWAKCPSCHRLHYRLWRDEDSSNMPTCRHERCGKGSELEQVSWVLIHGEGHMADLPWHFLTHRRAARQEQKQCANDTTMPYLSLKSRDDGGRGLELHCERCKATIKFNGSDERLSFNQTWQQPWLREPPEEIGGEPGIVVDINDTRVHSSITRSALVIPPESRIKKGSVVDRLYSNSAYRDEIEGAMTELSRNMAIGQIAGNLGCKREDIEAALDEIGNGYPLYGQNITPGLLLESEYQALVQPIPDVEDGEDFVTRHMTEAWHALNKEVADSFRSRQVIAAIDRVVAVNRLREIMVMQGFQRTGSEGKIVPPDIVGKSDWLPALELYGEGVFFTVSEIVLKHWETQPAVIERARSFKSRYHASGYDFYPSISVEPRFLLLHTISHILIRELETEAGYPAASLKERIYCSSDSNAPMSGILVYVAVPDVVGSLGGLGELAEPNRFLRMMTRVFDHAEWCSLDPACSEHEGQGPNLLNRAACHACALVPETSCIYGNMLLDRAFLKGSEGEGIPAFLDFVSRSHNG